MKLFVWVDPYQINYGSSLVFAVAEDVEAARAIAGSKAATSFAFGKYEHSVPGVSLGEPTRIVDLPCAEWHKWEE